MVEGQTVEEQMDEDGRVTDSRRKDGLRQKDRLVFAASCWSLNVLQLNSVNRMNSVTC